MASGDFLVRSARAEDEAETIALWRAAGLTVPHNDPSLDFRRALGKENSDILLAVDEDGTIIGSVMVGHDGHRGWVYYVAASAGRRLEGIGRRLMDASEQWLRARKVPKIMLMVRETNTKVLNFYERLGYENAPRAIMQKWLKD